MKYIKVYAPEWDALFQCKISEETIAAPHMAGCEVSDTPFVDLPILPRFKSEWLEADLELLKAIRK